MYWSDGVAIAETYNLKPGDKVRIYWTWNRSDKNTAPFREVTCDDVTK